MYVLAIAISLVSVVYFTIEDKRNSKKKSH